MKPKFNLTLIPVILALTISSLSCSSIRPTVDSATSTLEPSRSEGIVPIEPGQPSAIQTENPPTGQTENQPAAEAPTVTAAGSEITPTTPPPETSSRELGACKEEICFRDAYTLVRPVGGEGRVVIDPSYRFGEFRKNGRYPNIGVEFLNSTGTPVVAAASGTVLVAGTDSQIAYARSLNEYGNVIILEHDLPDFDQPVYTLYAHLAEILVQAGDVVDAGQEIAKVGATGNIRGSVLHFEVRVGENTYQAARNPELWLATRQDESGQTLGALAGRIIDNQGNIQDIPNIVVERLDASGQAVIGRTYLRTYGGESLRGLLPWEESFALGDMIPGTYKLSYLLNGYQQRLVEVQAGKLTLVTIVQ